MRIKVVREREAALKHGVVSISLNAHRCNVTGPAKTVADCFRHRERVGLDLAVEALDMALQRRIFTAAELTNAARICGVEDLTNEFLKLLT